MTHTTSIATAPNPEGDMTHTTSTAAAVPRC